MKRNWNIDELIEYFTFMPNELSLIGNKSGSTRLGFAILFKYFQCEAKFPTSINEIPSDVVQFIAKQLKIISNVFSKYNWNGRTIKYHRAQIRNFFGFRESNKKDLTDIINWLKKNTTFSTIDYDTLKEKVYERFRELCIEPPTSEQIERIIKTTIVFFENLFCENTFKQLEKITLSKIDSIIELSKYETLKLDNTISFSNLRDNPGKTGLESVFKELLKLETINQLELKNNLFKDISHKTLKKYKQRVTAEDLREIRRHPDSMKYTLLVIFFFVRRREITDNLIELLIQIIHRIGVRAEKRVDKELLKDFKRINGKTNLLFQMADTALNNPNGIIKQVIFPVISEKTLKLLVQESKTTGNVYRQRVHKIMRSSYSHHYRRMIPEILKILEFCSNNSTHKPVIQALELIKKNSDSSTHYFSLENDVPIEGVIKPNMKDAVIDIDKSGDKRINRINYEIATLQSLRDRLRCKEIWVKGAYRYRNPDEDLPLDFDQRREYHYKVLNQPLNSEEFISNIKNSILSALSTLNNNICKNDKVKIIKVGGRGKISISPFDPQPEPHNIYDLKLAVMKQWPMINLLDILKESDLRIGFTDCFKTVASCEKLDRRTIQKRLILSLFALGTNAGLKRISSGNHKENFKDLLYIRKKFINKDNLLNAIAMIVNKTLKQRIPEFWGEGTTTCASDAKKFGAWNQNLMTEWSIRYGGRGVMIYWHVEKKSLCIYSQLKTCSSSEVSAMIEGLLKHCTEIDIDKNFVDSHGQSEIGFAFCKLLGFNLMPRLKAIHKQKLYLPDVGMVNEYSNLAPILTRPINWELIRQQYDQMIKYTTALRLGTAETESILKRFNRNNLKHPTYLALLELGKAVKTIFLCKYLNSEALRIEINKGLNVIENWNSTNNFIFFGKSGEISTNRIEDQEIAVLSLHLLQNCLVYINTLMMQNILSTKQWTSKLTLEDLRAITPLFYTHINPYGNFDLDMKKRLSI